MDNKVSVMIDACGNAVPTRYVSKYDKVRDRNVRRIVSLARKLRTDIENYMIQSLALVDEIRAERDPKKLGTRGNFGARSFDGLMEVDIKQNYNLTLDERVIAAREKMLAYVNRVLDRVGGNDAQALKAIVVEAFQVASNGMLPRGKVFALLRMDIKDKDWTDAQQLLREALGGTRGRQYLRVFTRPDTNHAFRQILIDSADCWPVQVVNESEV